MADNLTKEQRRRNMQNIRSKDTKIELILRKALWNKGIHYRKNFARIPGKPDVVITKYKIAIFCDSEFFHGKDWNILKLRLKNGNNSDYWYNKILKNREHDDKVNKELEYLGWTVLRFWGKDIKNNTDDCVRTVEEAIFNIKMGEDYL